MIDRSRLSEHGCERGQRSRAGGHSEGTGLLSGLRMLRRGTRIRLACGVSFIMAHAIVNDVVLGGHDVTRADDDSQFAVRRIDHETGRHQTSQREERQHPPDQFM